MTTYLEVIQSWPELYAKQALKNATTGFLSFTKEHLAEAKVEQFEEEIAMGCNLEQSVLKQSFVWAFSPEGYDYWEEFFNSIGPAKF